MAGTRLGGTPGARASVRRIAVLLVAAMSMSLLMLAWLALHHDADATPVCTKQFVPTSGQWNVTANWSPAGVPGTGDTVCSPAGSSIELLTVATVTAADLDGSIVLSSSPASLRLTSTAVRSQLASAHVTNGSVLTLDGPGDIQYGNIDGRGVLNGNVTSSNGFVVVWDATVNGTVTVTETSELQIGADDVNTLSTSVAGVHLDGGTVEGFADGSERPQIGELVSDDLVFAAPPPEGEPPTPSAEIAGSLDVTVGGDISAGTITGDVRVRGGSPFSLATRSHLYFDGESFVPGWFTRVEGSVTAVPIMPGPPTRIEVTGDLAVCGAIGTEGPTGSIRFMLPAADEDRTISDCGDADAVLELDGGSLETSSSWRIEPELVAADAAILSESAFAKLGENVVALAGGATLTDVDWDLAGQPERPMRLDLGDEDDGVATRAFVAEGTTTIGAPIVAGLSSVRVLERSTLTARSIHDGFAQTYPTIEDLVVDGGTLHGEPIIVPSVQPVGFFPDLHLDGGTLTGNVGLVGTARLSAGDVAGTATRLQGDLGVTTIDGSVQISGTLDLEESALEWTAGDIDLCGRIQVAQSFTSAGATGAITDCSGDASALLLVGATFTITGEIAVDVATDVSLFDVDGTLVFRTDRPTWNASETFDLPNALSTVRLGPDVSMAVDTNAVGGQGAFEVPAGTSLVAVNAAADSTNWLSTMRVRVSGGTLEGDDQPGLVSPFADLVVDGGTFVGNIAAHSFDVDDVAVAELLVLDGGSGTIGDVTIDGVVAIEDGTLTLDGGIDLQGDIELRNAAQLVNDGTLMVQGSVAAKGGTTPTSITNSTGAQISLDYDGFVDVPSVPFANAGTLTIGGNGSVAAAFSQSAGLTDLTSEYALLDATTGASFTGGTLSGVGTVDGTITDGTTPNAFVVRPGGDAFGTLHVSGDFKPQHADLRMQVGGTAPGQFDRIAVTGQANDLSSGTGLGHLDVIATNGYVAADGDRIGIVTAATTVMNGLLFDTVSEDISGSLAAGAVIAAGGAGIDVVAYVPPVVSLVDANAPEPVNATTGWQTSNVTVQLSAAAPVPIHVSFAMFGDTATANVDFAQYGSFVTVPTGATSATFELDVYGDNLRDPGETLDVRIIHATGEATFPDEWGVVTIVDDPYDVADNCTKWARLGAATWSNASHWTPAGVPAAADVVCAIAGSDLTVVGTPTITGIGVSGSIHVPNGTGLTVTGANVWTLRNATLEGTVNLSSAAARLDVTGASTFLSAATVNGPGDVLVPSGSTLTWHAGGLANGVTLDNRGTITGSPGAALKVCGSSRLDNRGSVSFNSGSITLLWDCDAAGSLIVNHPGATFTANLHWSVHATIQVPFENAGAVTVTDGHLYLGRTNATPHAGTFQMLASAELRLWTPSAAVVHRFGPTATTTGTGLVSVATTGATADFEAGATLANLYVDTNGIVDGDPTLTGASTLKGTLRGPGTTTVNLGATLAWNTGTISNGMVLRNNGTTTWLGSGSVYACGGALVDNRALFVAAPAASAYAIDDCGSSTSRFVNASGATLRYATHWSVWNPLNIDVQNAGLLDLVSGNLNLTRANTVAHSGTVQIALDGALWPVGSVVHTFGATAQTTGVGYVELSGSVTLHAVGGAAFDHLRVVAGTKVTGSPTIRGLSSLLGSFEGPGTVTIAPGAELDWTGGGFTAGVVVDNQGRLDWVAGNTSLCGGARIENRSVFAIGSSFSHTAMDACGTNARIVNHATGSMQALYGHWSAWNTINPIVENIGTISITNGTLTLAGSLTNVVGNQLIGGTFDLQSGSVNVAGTSAGQITRNRATIIYRADGELRTTGGQELTALTSNGSEGALAFHRHDALASFTNEGTVTVHPTWQLTVAHYVQAAGATDIRGGAWLGVSSGQVEVWAGSTLRGAGGTGASVWMAGTIEPGDAGVGTFTVGAALTLTATSHVTAAVSVAGATSVSVGGAVTVAGTLDIVTAPAFTPVTGSTYSAITGSRNGQFAAVTGDDLPGPLRYDVQYGSTDVTLRVSDGFVVNSTADQNDWSPGDGLCKTFFNTCTLRAAVQEANATAGFQHIDLVTGATYTLTRAGAGEDNAGTGDLDIKDTVAIHGKGAVIDANQLDRAIDVRPSNVVSIDGVTIRNGRASGADGGGIKATTSTLVISSSTITQNAATGGRDGGGIFVSGGSLTVTGSTVSANNAHRAGGVGALSNAMVQLTSATVTGNTAANVGGGVGVGGTLTLASSTISSNSSANDGAGLYVIGTVNATGSTIASNTAPGRLGGGGVVAGTAHITTSTVKLNSSGAAGGLALIGSGSTIERSTFHGNTVTAPQGAAAIANFGGLTITNSTVSGNTAPTGGGAIFNVKVNAGIDANLVIHSSTVTANAGGGVRNDVGDATTIGYSIVGDQTSGANCLGTVAGITSAGYNLISDSSCPFTGPGDAVGTAPMLGPLADNGGPTLTHLPLAGSPAINNAGLGAPAIDQRGAARPYGVADKGAVEL